MADKSFHISDILTVTTGVFLGSSGIGGLYEILNHITDDNLFTHQLSRALKECQPFLKEVFPELANLDLTGVVDEETAVQFVKDVAERVGYEHAMVPQISKDKHEFIDPLQEALDIFGKDHVIGVGTVSGDE